MDLRALKYFKTVAECGSYSRGSELLRISQPAVSRTIRKLEEELGRDLFTRHGHGVTLTDAGRKLFERSQAVLSQLDQTAEEIRQGGTGPSGSVCIAVPPAAGHLLAPALVEAMRANLSNVQMKLVGGFSGYIHEWLTRGQADFALAHDPVPQRGFEIVPLVHEEVYVVGCSGSFATPEFATPEDEVAVTGLSRLPLILPGRPNASRRLLDAWTAETGSWVQPRIEVDDHLIARSLVRHGYGFSLLTKAGFSDDLARGDVEARPLLPKAHWTLALVSSLRTPRSEIVVAVMHEIQNVVRAKVAAGSWPGAAASSCDALSAGDDKVAGEG